MASIRALRLGLGTVGEFLAFLWRRKLWWLIPLALAILMMGMLLVFGEAFGVAPFMYTFF
jgi:presenilin-like A22 family membrane protease